MEKRTCVVMLAVALVFFAQGVEAEMPDPNLQKLPSEIVGEHLWDGLTSEDGAAPKGSSFGLEWQYYHLMGAKFVPVSSNECTMRYHSWYGFYLESIDGTTCSNGYVIAPMNLPAGAYLDRVACFTYDTDATQNIDWAFQRVEYPFPNGPPTYTNVTTMTRDYDTGWGEIWTSVGETIRYALTNAQFYGLRVWMDPGNTDHRLLACRLYWNRQIAPAPGTATFDDVGTLHWSFQNVEALVDAGITVGCGGNNYCPGQTVTRAEMAAFLARALGLHWPY